MLLDPKDLTPQTLYRFLIGVVVPRPIAFVSTVGAGGRFNVAPFSFFNAITSRPPLIGFSIGSREGGLKDTLRNLRAVGDFVVNVVDEPLLARAVHASGDWPEDVSEFELTGLTPVASDACDSASWSERARRTLNFPLYTSRSISVGTGMSAPTSYSDSIQRERTSSIRAGRSAISSASVIHPGKSGKSTKKPS